MPTAEHIDTALAEATTLPTVLESLRHWTPDRKEHKVLSVYLAVPPGPALRDSALSLFRDHLTLVREGIEAGQNAALEHTAAWVEELLQRLAPLAPPGLALFCSDDRELLVSVGLPRQPVDHVAWSDAPEIVPLHHMLADEEYVAAVLFDTQVARLFVTYLGVVKARREIKADDVKKLPPPARHGHAARRVRAAF